MFLTQYDKAEHVLIAFLAHLFAQCFNERILIAQQQKKSEGADFN